MNTQAATRTIIVGFTLAVLFASAPSYAAGTKRHQELHAAFKKMHRSIRKFKNDMKQIGKGRQSNGNTENSQTPCKQKTVVYSISVPNFTGMKVKLGPSEVRFSLDERSVSRWLTRHSNFETEHVFENSFDQKKQVNELVCMRTTTRAEYDIHMAAFRSNWLQNQDLWCQLRGAFGGCHPEKTLDIAETADVLVRLKTLNRDTEELKNVTASNCGGERGSLESKIEKNCMKNGNSACIGEFGELHPYTEINGRGDQNAAYRASTKETCIAYDYRVETKTFETTERITERLRFQLESIRLDNLTFNRQEDGSYVNLLRINDIAQVEEFMNPQNESNVELIYKNIEAGNYSQKAQLTRTVNVEHQFSKKKLRVAVKESCDMQ